jgi:deoxyhypusine monooxygenase
VRDHGEWLQGQREASGFTSVDPAPPEAPVGDEPEVATLRSHLLNTSQPMFQRMRAVFALRNIGGAVAIDALGEAFQDSSALLRHELAYVMGQMGDAHALPVLTEVLSKPDEHVMVRHEAAEAMGAIGDQSIRPVLEKFVADPNPEVSESCVVALDLLDWMASSEMEY